MLSPRNPAALIGLTHDVALIRLLRACGIQESLLKGASDYDGFLALAEAMPLCEGHPLRDKVNRILQEAVGAEVCLCPHTARAIWGSWTDIHWYGRTAVAFSAEAICPHCEPVKLLELKEESIIHLPDPLAVSARNMGEWGRVLEAALSGEYALFSLSDSYEFVRPDPYHANLAITRMAEGDTLSEGEGNLLITQAMRIWGQWILRNGWPGTLLLRGGRPSAVEALLSYLQGAKALSRLRWIPRDPTEAGVISGLYADVGTGVSVPLSCAEEEQREIFSAYATVAPIGRAVVMWG